jgi:hypothetical protein
MGKRMLRIPPRGPIRDILLALAVDDLAVAAAAGGPARDRPAVLADHLDGSTSAPRFTNYTDGDNGSFRTRGHGRTAKSIWDGTGWVGTTGTPCAQRRP